MRMDRRAGLLSATNKYAWKKYNIRYKEIVISADDSTYITFTKPTTYHRSTGSTSTTSRTSAFYVGSSASFSASTGQYTVNHSTQVAISSSGATTAKNKYMTAWYTTSGSRSASTAYKVTSATYSSSALSVGRQVMNAVLDEGYYLANEYSFDPLTGNFTAVQDYLFDMTSLDSSTVLLSVGKFFRTQNTSSTTSTGNTIYQITDAIYYSSTTVRIYVKAFSSEPADPIEDDFIGYVSSSNPNNYPFYGIQDGYFYVIASKTEIEDLNIVYTGDYTDEIVKMDDSPYRLLTLTSSGSLSIPKSVNADVWVCSGGMAGVGGNYNTRGGDGSVALSAGNFTTKDLVVVIGSGGTTGYGGTSSVSGDVTLSPQRYGGSGGGGTYNWQSGSGSSGDSIIKLPFNSSYFAYPYCDGGGGGGYSYQNANGVVSARGSGGSGGSNGSDGGSYSNSGNYGGYGGGHYGGRGGNGGSTSDSSSVRNGYNATGYGSGGGGIGCLEYASSTYLKGTSGYGYQGVCFVRIPVEQITTLPTEYTRLQYIQSTGSEAIDTNFIPTSSTEVVCEFEFTGISTSLPASAYIFGGGASAYSFSRYKTSSYDRFESNNTNVSFTITPDTSIRYRIRKLPTSTTINTVSNGIFDTKTTTDGTSSYTTYSLGIFANHSAATTYGNNASIKLYGFVIYNNGSMVRNLIPAKNSSNIAGLYDTSYNTFYTSVSSTQFTAGPVFS